MNIAIVGFSVEGQSSYKFLSRQGHKITICDQNAALKIPDGASAKLGEEYLDGLDEFDLIVRTAGLNPRIILAKNSGVEARITTNLNLFFEHSPCRNIIGVTGTKGKGTTSSLIYKMLSSAGKDVYLGGNIGTPPLDFIDKLKNDSWVVLELSSFQLCDFKYAPYIGICLMVVPEHLNWHKNMKEYVAAKANLFAHQRIIDTAIYLAGDKWSEKIASYSPGRLLSFNMRPGTFVAPNGDITIGMEMQPVCNVSDIKLLGEHNLQNVRAAITAVWQITEDTTAIKKALHGFSGLEHRLEFVREVSGVKYYDDSFGTTPETAIVAIKAFSQPKIIILGGSDKGAKYKELAKTIKQKQASIRKVLLIGQQAAKIKKALRKAGVGQELIADGGNNMTEIIETARQSAQPGDVVVLSPACASFDMFQNYKDRGNQFNKAVLGLK